MMERMGRLPFFSLRSIRPGMARLMADSMCEDSYSSWDRQSSRSRELAPDSSSSCSHSTLLLDIIAIVTITEPLRRWWVFIGETLIRPSPDVTWKLANRRKKEGKNTHKKKKITALNFSCPPPPLPLLLARTRTHPTHTSTRAPTSNTHAPMPMWSEQETWTCRGFSPFVRPSVRWKSGLHSSPSTSICRRLAPTLDADANDASPRYCPALRVWDEWPLPKRMIAVRSGTCWPAKRLWIVISTGSAVRAGPPEEGGAASVKGAALRSCRRLTFITLHWCFRNTLNDNST